MYTRYCVKTGLPTLHAVCVILMKLFSYYLSNTTMPFYFSFVPVELIVALSMIRVLQSCLFSFHRFMLFYLVYVCTIFGLNKIINKL